MTSNWDDSSRECEAVALRNPRYSGSDEDLSHGTAPVKTASFRGTTSTSAKVDLGDVAETVVMTRKGQHSTPPQRTLVAGEGDFVGDDSPRSQQEEIVDDSYDDLVSSESPRGDMPPADNPWVVHGNWCGPGWTGGRKVTASTYDEYGGDWNYPAIDALDAACRDHDKACVGGCNSAADAELARRATAALTDPDVPKDRALIVAGGMTATAAFARDDSPLKPVTDFVVERLEDIVHIKDKVSEVASDPLDSIRRPEKGVGHGVRKGLEIASQFVDDVKAPKLAKAAKFVPIVGSALDAVDWYEDAAEHGVFSKESAAAALDFTVNLVPPLAVANDVYSIVTGDDGFFQGWFGDED